MVIHLRETAEREGFEPPEVLPSSVFKTDAIDHSAISPLLWDVFLFRIAIRCFPFASAKVVGFFELCKCFLIFFAPKCDFFCFWTFEVRCWSRIVVVRVDDLCALSGFYFRGPGAIWLQGAV